MSPTTSSASSNNVVGLILISGSSSASDVSDDEGAGDAAFDEAFLCFFSLWLVTLLDARLDRRVGGEFSLSIVGELSKTIDSRAFVLGVRTRRSFFGETSSLSCNTLPTDFLALFGVFGFAPEFSSCLNKDFLVDFLTLGDSIGDSS